MIERLLLFLSRYDWLLILPVFVLTAIGLAAIYSVDISRGDTLIYFPKQVIALVIGSICLFIGAQIHKVRYESIAKSSYLFGLLLLAGVLLFGVTIRGTTGWFRIAGFSFQPAEFAKVSLVLLLAWWASKQGRRFDTWQYVLSTTLAMGFYVGLIMLQPDLGSASVLVAIWFGILFASGVKKRYLIGFVLSGVVIAIIGWLFLFQDYQKDRVLTFLQPDRDPLGSGYNVTQSLIAIGSGKFFGRGLGFGSQSQLHFLPEAQTDFIIAVIGEELGFIGLIFVIVIYFLLLWRLLTIAGQTKDDFSAYTILGIAILFFTQLFVNIGGATGLLPVTGVTLPFLSYGGSSLMINYILIGIAGSISREKAKIYL